MLATATTSLSDAPLKNIWASRPANIAGNTLLKESEFIMNIADILRELTLGEKASLCPEKDLGIQRTSIG